MPNISGIYVYIHICTKGVRGDAISAIIPSLSFIRRKTTI